MKQYFISMILFGVFLGCQQEEPVETKRAKVIQSQKPIGMMQKLEYDMDFLSESDSDDSSIKEQYGIWINIKSRIPTYLEDYVDIRSDYYGAKTVESDFGNQFTGLFIRPDKVDSDNPVIIVVPGSSGLIDERTKSLLGFTAAGFQVFALDLGDATLRIELEQTFLMLFSK